MNEARDCSSFLGVYIAEEILSNFFENVKRMPYGNPGYDYICSKGHKIDVKSSCLRHPEHGRTADRWTFHIRKNRVADYFVCIGFDDRQHLNPMRVWIFPGKDVQNKMGLLISNTHRCLGIYKNYEKPINRALDACNKMKISSRRIGDDAV